MEHITRKHGGSVSVSNDTTWVVTTDGKIFGCGKNTDGKIFGCGKNTDGKIFGCGKNTDGQQGEGHDDFKGIIETIPITGGL